VPKDEFIEVYLELGLAHTMVGANEPPLEVANRSIGKGDSGLRTSSKFRAERLVVGEEYLAVKTLKGRVALKKRLPRRVE